MVKSICLLVNDKINFRSCLDDLGSQQSISFVWGGLLKRQKKLFEISIERIRYSLSILWDDKTLS